MPNPSNDLVTFDVTAQGLRPYESDRSENAGAWTACACGDSCVRWVLTVTPPEDGRHLYPRTLDHNLTHRSVRADLDSGSSDTLDPASDCSFVSRRLPLWGVHGQDTANSRLHVGRIDGIHADKFVRRTNSAASLNRIGLSTPAPILWTTGGNPTSGVCPTPTPWDIRNGQPGVLGYTCGDHPRMNTKDPHWMLHFVLRYSDLLRDVDTYATHKVIETHYGSVWWGKFGLGVSPTIVTKAKAQLKAAIPTYVYLATKRSIIYRGRLLEILGGGVRTPYRPKQLSLIPAYYRRESCTVWFRLTNLRTVSPDEKGRLVLYNSRSFAPELNGMRGLIYVTHGKPSRRPSRRSPDQHSEKENEYEDWNDLDTSNN